MRFLLLGTLLLAGLFGTAEIVHAQPKDPKETSKDPPKDPAKDPPKPPEITESTEIGGKKLAAWVVDLKDMHDPSTRDKAVRAIINYGTAAQDYAGLALLDRLRDNDIGVRSKAILAVGVVGVPLKDTAKLIDGLADCLKSDPQVLIRFHAVAMLARLGTGARAAIPVLVYRSTDPQSWEIRKLCLFTLGEAGQGDKAKNYPPDAHAVTAALNGLKDACAEVRMEAASTLYALYTPAPPSDVKIHQEMLALIQQRILVEKDMEVQIWLYMAKLALHGFKEDALKDLTKLFKDPDPQVREQAVNALASLGEKGRPGLGEVLDLVAKDKEPQVIYAAMFAAWKIGGDKDKIISALTQVPKRPDLPTSAVEVLKKASEQLISFIKDGKKPT
jgi:HEAT repeat protein